MGRTALVADRPRADVLVKGVGTSFMVTPGVGRLDRLNDLSR